MFHFLLSLLSVLFNGCQCADKEEGRQCVRFDSHVTGELRWQRVWSAGNARRLLLTYIITSPPPLCVRPQRGQCLALAATLTCWHLTEPSSGVTHTGVKVCSGRTDSPYLSSFIVKVCKICNVLLFVMSLSTTGKSPRLPSAIWLPRTAG